MDSALTYIELNRWESRVPILRAELDVAENVEYTVAERVKEGVEQGIARTKAGLVAGQVRMHMIEAEGAVDILRTRLSQLTGLPANSIRTERDSIPVLKEDTHPMTLFPGRSSPALRSKPPSNPQRLSGYVQGPSTDRCTPPPTSQLNTVWSIHRLQTMNSSLSPTLFKRTTSPLGWYCGSHFWTGPRAPAPQLRMLRRCVLEKKSNKQRTKLHSIR
jgi:hypothetical protein